MVWSHKQIRVIIPQNKKVLLPERKRHTDRLTILSEQQKGHSGKRVAIRPNVDRQTDTGQNITFPRTTYAVGKYDRAQKLSQLRVKLKSSTNKIPYLFCENKSQHSVQRKKPHPVVRLNKFRFELSLGLFDKRRETRSEIYTLYHNAQLEMYKLSFVKLGEEFF